jgi:hypothetical protein
LARFVVEIKAAGFNAFSLYAHWGYHNPTPGVLDFSTSAHNFTPILRYVDYTCSFARDLTLTPKPTLVDFRFGLQLALMEPFETPTVAIQRPGSHTSPSSVKSPANI